MLIQITSEKLYLAKRKRNEAEKQNIIDKKKNDSSISEIEMIVFVSKEVLDSKYYVL